MAIKRIHARSPYYITSNSEPIPPPTDPIEYFGVNCGDFNIAEGFIGKRIYTFTMTGDTGDIVISYGGGSIPVKITLAYNGASTTTGYVGLDAYDSELIALGIDPSEINTGPTSTKTGTLTLPKASTDPLTATITVQSPILSDLLNLTFTCPTEVPPAPTCPDRALVLQICNSNSITDDNFEIYLNDNYIGFLDLEEMYVQNGSIFIATTNENLSLVSADFVCPLTLMETYRFNPSFLNYGENKLEMRNVKNNGYGNLGSIGVRNYIIDGDTLSNPCVVTDLEYGPRGGESQTIYFDYTACCPED